MLLLPFVLVVAKITDRQSIYYFGIVKWFWGGGWAWWFYLFEKLSFRKGEAKRNRRRRFFFSFSFVFCLPEMKNCLPCVGNCSSFARLALCGGFCVPCKCAAMCGGVLGFSP